MSLIVARATSTSVFFVSDTKITYQDKGSNPYVEGISKVIVLDEKRCIAFAGDINLAEIAIKGISRALTEDEIVSRLVESTESSKVEYILSNLNPTPKLLSISNGTSRDSQAAWIGDQIGFRNYQGFFTSGLDEASVYGEMFRLGILKMPEGCPESDQQLYQKMFTCLAAVINSNEVESVGGFVVPVISDRGAMKFGSYSSVLRKPLENYELKSTGGIVPFGGVDTGSFTFILCDLQNDKFGLHINQGNLGIIFNQKDSLILEPETLSGFDEIDFNTEIKKRFDSQLPLTVGHTAINYFKKGEKLFNKKEYLLALKFITKGFEAFIDTWVRPEHREDLATTRGISNFLYSNKGYSIPEQEVKNLFVAYFHRGICYYNLEAYEEAQLDLQESANLNGSSFEPKFWLACSHHALGNSIEAITILKEICSKFNNYTAFELCGKLLNDLGKYAEADYYLDEAEKLKNI